MAAIKVHHTAVDTNSSWDRSKVTATGKAALRYVSAWVDSNADPELIGSYKLMHHYRDGGPAIIAGVNNAKARLSQTDMPQGDRAGVLAHLNAHQSDAKQSILQTIKGWFERLFDTGEVETNERAISMPNIYQLVYAELDKQVQADQTYRPLIDVYLDGASMYAVFAMNGQLYKADLLLTPGGVAMGVPVLVEIDYKPAAQALKTTRQANGQYRWFAFPAATAVLNRSGELDSRELFQNFVKRIEEGQPYPFLTFYHIGEKINLGQADYVQADEYALLISGLWHDTPLADATRKAIEANPDHYGISIGYMYQPDTKQKLEVAEGITIPVYTDGILVECSILAEQDAACLMTGAYTEGVQRMNKHAKDELEKIVAGDPALEAQVAELEEKVDEVNQSTEGLIRREGEEAAPTEPEAPTAQAAEAASTKTSVEGGTTIEFPMHIDMTKIDHAIDETLADLTPEMAAKQDFEFTEEAMRALSKYVASNITTTFTKQISAITIKQEQVVAELNGTITKLVERITKLEAPLEETVKQAVQDMPRNLSTKVGYRPTKPEAVQPETETESLADIAQATLANLKQKGA